MCHGLVTIDKNTFLFDPATGAMQVGWVTLGENQYYFEPVTGALYKGLMSDGIGIKYCSEDDGHQVFGFATINKKLYYFDPASGYMLANTVLELGEGVFAIDEAGIVTQIQ